MSVVRAAERHATGVAVSADNRPAAAVRHLRVALRQATAAGDHELRVKILISLAWAEAERGQVGTGFRLLSEAERQCPPGQRGILHGQRGLLLRRTGQDEAAIVEYDAAIATLDDGTHPEDLAKALSNRALAHLAAARIKSARADLLRSVQIAERHQLALPAAVARHNLADLDLLRGDIPAAIGGYSTAAEVYTSRAPGKLATLAVDRARALLAAGLFGEADRYLAEAVQRALDQRLSHVHADALLARAQAALLGGDPAAAAQWASHAHLLFARRGNARKAGIASLISLRAEQAASPASTGLATRAQALASSLGQLKLGEDARVAALVGVRVLAALGQPAAAGTLARACGPARPTDRLDTRMLTHLARAQVADAAGRSAVADRERRTGMTVLRRYRGRLGCLDLQTGAAVHGKDLAAEGLARALESGSAAAVFRWSERAKAQALLLAPASSPADPADAESLEELRQIRSALRVAELTGIDTRALRRKESVVQLRIRENSWSAAAGDTGLGPQPVSLSAVRAELTDSAMIVYLRAGDQLHGLVVTARLARAVPLGQYEVAQELVLRLRADLDASAGRRPLDPITKSISAAAARDAALLGSTLLGPLSRLTADRNLVVVPTGILITVPWAMLTRRGRSVVVAPSASTWLAAARRVRNARFGQTATVVMASGPGIARGTDEIAAIRALRPGAEALTGDRATPAAVLRAIDGATIAHLAAHGIHQPDNALFSALELSGGQLMGYDVSRLRAAPLLAVLSCCDLGLADVRPGDETLGMTTALLHAGAGSVLSSVTRVSDNTAMRVMTGLHAGLLRGMQPGQALARAAADEPGGFVCFGAG